MGTWRSPGCRGACAAVSAGTARGRFGWGGLWRQESLASGGSGALRGMVQALVTPHAVGKGYLDTRVSTSSAAPLWPAGIESQFWHRCGVESLAPNEECAPQLSQDR